MVRVLNESKAFLPIIYNQLLNFDIYDKIMTPPDEGGYSEVMW